MRHGFIKVAAITPKIKVADPVFNAEEICFGIEEAKRQKVKIAVFPELCITGYTCGDLFLQDRLLDEAKMQMKKVIACTEGYDGLVFVGFPFSYMGKLYNAAAAFHDGEILGIIPKTHIPGYGEFYERRHFMPAPEETKICTFLGRKVPFGTKLLFQADCMEGLVVGCEICEDLWMADTPSAHHTKAGAAIIVNPSASDETIGKDEYREMLVKSASARLVAGYVYASAGEGESTQDLVFGGHNIIAENGTVLAQVKKFTCEMLTGEIDVQRLLYERRRISTYESLHREDYTVIPFHVNIEETHLNRTFAPMPFVPSDAAMRKKRCEEILLIQSYGLKKRYEHTGCKTAVLGISGGLDSTLALLVTVRTFDLLNLNKRNIIAVTMPCFGTTDRTYDNACRLAKELGITLREVDIKDAVRIHFRDIGQDETEHDVTYENSQARERTQILMDIANKENGLVIGTGDMSELALGWATYNGDHMSMYGVNVGVPKTLVRHLVSYCADVCENGKLNEILTNILNTPVSPELLPPVDGKISQKTEDLVGPYELHDFFLYYMLRLGFSPEKIFRLASLSFRGQYEREVILKWLKIFYRRFFTQQFKRSCLPDGPKVGSVAVSPRGDLRMPSDASMNAWKKQLEELTVL